MGERPTRHAGAGELEFLLDNFEHLVETPRGHIVRITGRWRGPTSGAVLPHPSLLIDEPADAPLMVPPLPLPDHAPPYVDGATPWSASYSIPKDRFAGGRGPACRLQAAPGVVYPLEGLALPDRPAEATMRRPAPSGATALATATREARPQAGDEPPEPEAPSAPPPGFTDLILPAMRAHRRLVAGIVALSLVSAIAGTFLRNPTYTGVAKLAVTPLPREDVTLAELPDVRASSDPESTIETAAELVRSPEVAGETARRLGAPWTERDVLREVELEPVGGSNALTVTATDEDGPTAARLANEFAESAVAVRDRRLRELATSSLEEARDQLDAVPDKASAQAQALQLRITALRQILSVENSTLSVAQPAAVPANPAGLPAFAVVILTALAGLVLGGAAAVLLDLVGARRIADVRDATGVYPLPILTRVPTLGRRGRGGRAAGLSPQLRDAFRTLQLELELADGVHDAVLFTSPANGDGKTTSAIAFALTAADSGREVILIDLDLRKPDVAARLGVTAERGIEDVVGERATVEDVLAPVPGTPRLRVLTPVGPLAPRGLGEVARRLDEILDEATRAADFVVVDTPPVAEISDALAFARAADDVLLVCRIGRTPIPQLENARDLLERTGLRPAGIVLVD